MNNKLKPAFLLNNVVVAVYVKHIGKFNPQEQLDTFFQSQATQNGKKVDGLETAEFVSRCKVFRGEEGGQRTVVGDHHSLLHFLHGDR